MFEHIPIRRRLYGLTLIMLMLSAIIAASGLAILRDHLLTERQNQCRMLVRGVLGYMERLNGMVQAGGLTPDEAQARAIGMVAAMSSRQGDYLWIIDLNVRVVWHPMPEWNGRDLSGQVDAAGRRLFKEFIDRTIVPGGALVAYDWPDPKSGRMGRKISYVERFGPWGGWSVRGFTSTT